MDALDEKYLYLQKKEDYQTSPAIIKELQNLPKKTESGRQYYSDSMEAISGRR
ncbi:MAG: hypothetical protein V7711_05340 [Pseudomonadales bacterium]